jgi:hypothetical protein
MNIDMTRARTTLLSAILLAMAAPLAATPAASGTDADTQAISPQVVSPQAQAVLNRMTAYLRGLQTFSIDTDSTRDEVVALGYKLQHNEHSTLVVQRPNKLRADIDGDVRARTIVFDSGKLTMYSPDDAAYVKTPAPDTIGTLIGTLLDLGVEMPSIDVLYSATAGSLTDQVRGGIVVGMAVINGVPCDHLAFRQADIDWQLWVEQGARPVPRKILITTRYEVGDPQYQAVLTWDMKPRIAASTFVFVPPAGAMEIPLDQQASSEGSSP